MIRVAVAAATVQLRGDLARIVSDSGRLELVWSGESLDQLDVAEVDVLLIEGAGAALDAARSWDQPAPGVVVLSDDADLISSLPSARGGFALLPTSAMAEQIVAAAETAALGLVVLHPDHINTITAIPSADPLTPREREVLQMLAAGLGNKAVALRLGISEHTAKFHVAQILAKLSAASRAEAVSIGIRRGLVPL
jgi:DNA-binding NarL/FixJ family response regulator